MEGKKYFDETTWLADEAPFLLIAVTIILNTYFIRVTVKKKIDDFLHTRAQQHMRATSVHELCLFPWLSLYET